MGWRLKGTKKQIRVMTQHADKDADATVALRRYMRNRDAAIAQAIGEQPFWDPEHNDDHMRLARIVQEYPDKIEQRSGGIERLDREKAKHSNYTLQGVFVVVAVVVEFFGMQDLLRIDGMPGGFSRVIIALMGALVMVGLVNLAVLYLLPEETQ